MSFQRDLLAKKLRDPQAKILSDLIQMQHNESQETTNYITSNLKGYALKSQDKTVHKDKYYVNIQATDIEKNYYTTKYPDYDNLRLYLLVENGDKLHDYSMMQNKAFAYSDGAIQEIYIREDENNISKHEIVSYFTGTHYVIVKDNKKLRISDIIVDEPTKEGFTIIRRLNLLKTGNSSNDSVILWQKTDSSSNRYATSINVDENGSVYFYVRFDHKQYFCKLNNAFDIHSIPANFFMQNFKIKNFKTEADLITKFKEELFDVACSFNFTTKEATIQLRYKNNALLTASSIAQLPPYLQLHLPMQDGEWSDTENVRLNKLYDISGNGLDGVIGNPTSALWDNDNTFRSDLSKSVGIHSQSPANAALNSLSEFTVCFWIKPHGITPTVNNLFRKGNESLNRFTIKRDLEGDILFQMSINSGTTVYEVTKQNCFPDPTQWYFVTCKWKSGEKLKISINDEPDTVGDTDITGTLGTTSAFRVLDGTPDDSTLMNVIVFSRQLTDIQQTQIHLLGPHNAQFPMNKPAQITANPNPDPVTNPFSYLYDLPKIASPTLNDYVFINNPSAGNPYYSKYECPDGSPYAVSKTSVYDIANGVTIVGQDTRGTFSVPSTDTTVVQLGAAVTTGTTSVPSTDNSYSILSKDNNTITGVQIVDAASGIGQILNGKKITEITFWFKRISDAGGTAYCRIWDASGVAVRTLGSFNIADSALGMNDSTWVSKTFTDNNNTVTMATGFRIGIEWITSVDNDELRVQRKTGDYDISITQGYYDGSWKTNSAYEIKFTAKYETVTSGYKLAGLSITDINSNGGQQINAKAITHAVFYLKNVNSATGTAYCRVWNSSGAVVTTLGSVDVSTINSADFVAVPFTANTNTHKLGVESVIGVEYNTGTGSMQVHMQTRNADIDTSIKIERNDGTSWSIVTNQELKCDLSYGELTFDQDPRYVMYSGNYQVVAEKVGATSNLINKPITEQTITLQRTPTATGTLTWKMWRSNGSVKKVFNSTIDLSTISTTENQLVTFSDPNNTIPIETGDRIGIVWNDQPIDQNAKLYVMSNFNNLVGNNHDSDNSYITLYDSVSGWRIDQTLDLSGQMFIGGFSFTASEQFTDKKTRIYQRCVNENASFYNQRITKTKVRAKRVGTIPQPSTITCTIRNQSNEVMTTLESIDSNTISQLGYVDLFFTNPSSEYVVSVGDYISFEITSCDSTNYIVLNINDDVVDIGNSVLGTFDDVPIDRGLYDLAGAFYTGGGIDNISRNRVGQFINTQDSLFVKAENNKVSEVTFTFTKKGDPTGNVFINIRRGTDDSPIKTLATFAASGIGTALTGTTLKFTDVTNTYRLETKDILTIEYNGGDQDNSVGVQVRAVTPNYDGTNSYIAMFNGSVYNYNLLKDLVGVIRVGGDTYTPDPNAKPPNMPQSNTDIYIGVKGERDSSTLKERSIVSSILFTTEILTNLHLDNFYKTRIDFESNEPDEVLVTNYAFIKDI